MEQGSAEWLEARLGKVTASRVSDVVAKTKTGWGASRANYMAELISERLTGVPAERFTNAAMMHGTEQEPHARAAYAALKGFTIDQVGFILHPLIPMSGASPDGLIVEHNGLVEIKCPNTATHIETLLGGSVPAKYVTQMHWQMACTGRQFCDFVSYDPRLPENMQLFVQRIPRDAALIADLEEMVSEFLIELDSKIEALQKACEERKAA